MNDKEWCALLRYVVSLVDARQYIAASDALYAKREHYSTSQYHCARDTLAPMLCQMQRDGGTCPAEFLTKVDRILRNHGDSGLMRTGARRMTIDYETHANMHNLTTSDVKRDLMCAAYGGTPKHLTQQQLADIIGLTSGLTIGTSVPADFSNLERRIAAMEQPVNKTSIELRAELDAAEQAEAIAAEKAARAAKLDAYGKLAAATTILLNRMRDTTTSPDRLLAQHRFELKALAAEFGFRIVLIGDRTQAVLVQA